MQRCKGNDAFFQWKHIAVFSGGGIFGGEVVSIFPLQTKQFQAIRMTEKVIEAISLNQTCIGLGKQAFNAHVEVANDIPVFRFSSAEIGQRIQNSAVRELSMDFVEYHP